VFAIATLAIFTRFLSPAEYGVYALGVSISTVASAILFQWINEAVGRFYPIYLDEPGKILAIAGRGFWKAAAVSLLLFLGVLPFLEVFGIGATLVGILFLITVSLGRYTLALQVANAQGAPVRYCLLSWAKGGGALAAGFVFIFYGISDQGALLGLLVGLVFAVVAFSPNPWMSMKLGSVDTRRSEEMFHYGLPLTLNFLAILIVDVSDRFMIGKLLGAAQVAPYAVAYDLVQQSLGAVMNVLFLSTFPLIVKVFEGDGDEPARIHLHNLGSWLVSLGLPIAVGVGVLASEISETIFTSNYSKDAGAVMPWLAAAIFVAILKSNFLDLAFQLRHVTKYQVYIAILMAVVNIVLNLLLLPLYGVIAAAWATLAAFAVGALVSWLAGKSIFTLPALGNVFWKSACASASMAVVLCILPSTSGTIWLLAKIALGFVTYSSIAWALDVAGCRGLIIAFISQRTK